MIEPRAPRIIFKWRRRCLGLRIFRCFCRSGFGDEKAAAVTQLGLLRPAWRLNIQVQKQFKEFTTNIRFIATAI